MIRIRKQLLLCPLLLGVLFQSAAASPRADDDAARQNAARTIIVVDSAVKNPSELLQSHVHGNREIIFLKPGDDPVESIGKALSGKKIRSLHIVSHGGPGQLILANRLIDGEFLKAHRRELGRWRSSLAPNSDIFLYGCDVAQGAKGREFVEMLAAATSAGVAASVNKTGHQLLGGDWHLEFSAGRISTQQLISSDWAGLLDITTGLKARWALDANANDSSGNSYNGTLSGATIDTTAASNKVGAGKLSLNGTNNYVNLNAHASSFSGQTQGTVSAWVRTSNSPTADGSDQIIFSISNSATTDHAWMGLEAGVLEWHVNDAVAEIVDIQGTTALNDNAWHHVAVTVDAGGTKLYVDGIELTGGQIFYDTGTANSTEFFDDASGLNRMELGVNISSYNSGAGYGYYGGLIDDVRVYDRALSASDVLELSQYAYGFTVTESGDSTTVSEAGTTDTFSVVLNYPPTSNVVIDVSSGDTGEATVSPASLTFTTGNWNVAQTITVTGVDDALNDRTQSTAITLSINDAGSDNNYDPLSDQIITADTLDDEANASPTNNLPSSQNVNEDSFLLFNDANGNKISITDDAGENLEVTIGVANGTLTLSQTTGLTFTNGDGAADAAMTFSGTVENTNSALDGMRYDPAADFNGNETLTISTSDEILLSYELDANLQGYYKFDSGDPTGDGGPNAAPDGTLLDNATFAVDATRGDVLSLDGVDDGFDVATRFGQPATFTLAAWVNVTGVDTNAADIINIGDNILIRADASTTNNWGDGVSATIFTAPSTWTILKSGQYIVGTGWHHVAFTYDSGTGMARLYLDGTEVVAMASAAPDWSLVGSTTRIGKHGAADTTADFGGNIDDARIYNRALSATEVSELYLAPTQTTDTGTLTITVAPVNDSPTGAVLIDNTTPQVTDTLTASNTLADVDGISGPISYQWRRDGVNIGGATGSTYSVAAADIGAVISVTASYTDDDGTAESVNSADTAAVVSSGDFTITESGGTAVSESGTTDTFTVVLNVQPAADVVIDVSSGDTGEVTVSPSSLTFTNGNWNVAQTVTVTGVNDSIIDGTQNTTITLSVNDASSDNNYDPVADKTVTASTADNDSAGFSVAESGGNTSVNESGTTDTFTVVLTAQPVSDVVIDVTSGDTGEATVSPASLTFTNGNWNVAQAVTVTGADDALIDGTQNSTITISVNDAASDDSFDPLADQTVTASTADNDSAGFVVTESGGNTSVNESGTTDTFTVVLSAQPNSDVVIDISSGDTGEATVSPASLTFAGGNWNVAQTVTVTGVDDALIDGNQNTTITAAVNDGASDNNFDPLSDQTVTATTADNDAAGFTVVESGGNTSVNESGTTDTFTVVLAAQPGSDVVIDVSSADTGEATVSPASLTFTNGNWNVAQTVTVTGADDALVDGAQNTAITLSVNDAASDDNFDPLADQAVTATTVDSDAAGFTAVESGGGTSVNESGTTDTFTVVLNAQPNSDVVVDVSSGDTGEATVSPASLTFTAGNWSTAQTVTVTGVDDALIDGDQNTVVTVSINDAGSDDNFDPLADQSVMVTTVDNDTAGFTVVEAGGGTSVNESGTTDTFTVVLTSQPNSDVVIDLSSGDTGEATVSPASLTFTAGNWSTAQTVTVTGADDSSMDGNQNSTITVSINDAASDDDYDPLPDQTVTVTTVDDDAAGFTVTETGGNTAVNESGTTDTFTVVLNAQPAGNVVIDISSGDTGEATVSPASLTFTDGNWNVAQAVTVTGIDDVLIDGNQSITITLSVNDAASDNNFDPLPDRTVTVTVIDDDASPDADNDGIPNVVEGLADADFDGTPNFLDTDSDNDGILDRLEADNIPPLTGLDADSDGIDDVIDVDSTGGVDMNADGVDDAFEPVDSDGDGTPDYLDTDSDNDGIPDGIEADNVPVLTGSDADGDGIDDALDTGLTGGPDADGNGVDDRYEPRDSDSDGLADYLDSDSDNDGIHDSIEGSVVFADSDGDGIDDRYDIDVTGGADIDSDGADDNAAPDSDNDGRPDYRDLDSDNDGLPDVGEAGLTDADGDGFADNAVTTLSPLDTDSDGTADYHDPDSDNDGVFDIATAGYTQYDGNNDGQIDAEFFVDPDNDGVPDVIDPAPAVFGLLNNGDSDGDGVPDYTDMDDDNDGIPDAVESPGGVDIDSDGDGIVDRLDRDSDNDGIPDSLEGFYSFELDSDLDGVIDDATDTDLDGIADVVPASMTPEDTDGDGNPDYLDLDSDNDGLYDLLELAPANYSTFDAGEDGRIDGPVDSDGDGLADEFDPDSGSYLSLQIPDSDNDGIADFRDTDSDNDGFDDSLENGDFNGNGIMDFVESGRGISTSIPNGGGGGGSGWLWITMLLLFNRQKKIRKRV